MGFRRPKTGTYIETTIHASADSELGTVRTNYNGMISHLLGCGLVPQQDGDFQIFRVPRQWVRIVKPRALPGDLSGDNDGWRTRPFVIDGRARA